MLGAGHWKLAAAGLQLMDELEISRWCVTGSDIVLLEKSGDCIELCVVGVIKGEEEEDGMMNPDVRCIVSSELPFLSSVARDRKPGLGRTSPVRVESLPDLDLTSCCWGVMLPACMLLLLPSWSVPSWKELISSAVDRAAATAGGGSFLRLGSVGAGNVWSPTAAGIFTTVT
jgi:hypothetical protein